MNLALQGLEEVKNNVDTMLIIPNQNLFKFPTNKHLCRSF